MKRSLGSTKHQIGSWTVLLAGAFAWAGVDLVRMALGTGPALGRFSFSWLLGLAGYGLASALAILSVYSGTSRRLAVKFSGLAAYLGWARYLLSGMLASVPAILLLSPWGSVFLGWGLRILILLIFGFLSGLVLSETDDLLLPRLYLGLLITAGLFAMGKALNLVRDYPFKLGWSEGNRLWDYSLYFSRSRYHIAGDFNYPNYLSPGRHGLWGLPFLLPGVTIVGVRLWNVVVNLLPNLLLSWVLLSSRHLRLHTVIRMAIGAWVFLFLVETCIFAPITLCAVLVYLGVRRGRFGWAVALTVVASIYAAITRWTWVVAPGAWGVLLYLLLAEDRGTERLVERLVRTVAIGAIGLGAGVITHLALASLQSGAEVIDLISFKQPLLWYRLLPNPTYLPGILLALAMAAGPVVIFIAVSWCRGWLNLDKLQWLGVFCILSPLFVVGLVVSVKIGGGSNLHNMDMFLLGLILMAGIVFHKVYRHVNWLLDTWSGASQAVLLLALLTPVLSVVQSGGPLRLPPEDVVSLALQETQQVVARAAEQGEVLFIDQRQLLTFGYIRNVPLVLDYELKDLTNRAMIGNQALFADYYQDLATHRFEMIVTGHLPTEWRGRGHPFGEEDDAQVRFIYLPLLEYYQPVLQLEDVGVWLLAPKGTATDDQAVP